MGSLYHVIQPPSQIGPNWALTAAHCVHDEETEAALPASSLYLVLGVHDRTRLTARARKVAIRKVIIHYDYNIATPWRDIALLKLAERVDLFDFPPVCLPGQDDSFNNMTGMVYGKKVFLCILELRNIDYPMS